MSKTIDIIATADSFTEREHGTANHGTEQYLQLDYTLYTPFRHDQAFLFFPMTAVPSGKQIDSALLYMYVAIAEVSANLNKPYTLNASWDELTITRGNKPSVKSFLGNRISIASIGWKTVDIKTFVEYWCYGLQDNYGIQIEPEYYEWSSHAAFYSREKANYEPYIKVKYSDPSRPLWTGPHNNLQII